MLGVRIAWKALRPQLVGSNPIVLLPVVWGGAGEFAHLSSQVLLHADLAPLGCR